MRADDGKRLRERSTEVEKRKYKWWREGGDAEEEMEIKAAVKRQYC